MTGPLARSDARMSLERENDLPQTDDNYHSKLFPTPSL